MSILSLPFHCTSTGAAGFSLTVAAKRDQSQKKKKQRSSSTPTTRRAPVGFEQQLKKGTSSSPEGLIADNVSIESTTTSTTSGSSDGAAQGTNIVSADRVAVMKACIGTSAGLLLGGYLLRQASHWGAESGWQILDCTTLMPYKLELWHVVPTVGVVVLVSSLRQILLQVWPDFAESSEVANNQVLRSLTTVDIFTVSYLTGVSEELVFRGALLPLLGPDWKGVVGAGLIFGALHLSGGRNASFALWASFVGILYGILGLYTNDLVTPMVAHSAANLVGAAIWKISQNEQSNGM